MSRDPDPGGSVSSIGAVGRAGTSLLVDHGRRGVETGGKLVVLPGLTKRRMAERQLYLS